jgi:Tol biopolymer transport system component
MKNASTETVSARTSYLLRRIDVGAIPRPRRIWRRRFVMLRKNHCLSGFLGLAMASSLTGICVAAEFPELEGPYLGQKPPGAEPRLFAPGIVSTHTGEWSMAATPDGKEIFFGLVSEERSCIVHTKLEGGRWTEPAIASFGSQHNDFDLTMSPTGDRVYFTSMRPPSGHGPRLEHPDIYYVDRTASGWGDPVRFPEPINTEVRELYPSESRDGYIYFFSNRSGGFGGSDVWRVAIQGKDSFGEPENLGANVNTSAGEGDPCISPKGDYIVFSSRREDGLGGGDLYVSFQMPDGSWSLAQNLGASVNTEHLEFCPSISRDGKYLFFTSRRPKTVEIPIYRNTVREELKLKPNTERGDIDIYWVDAEVVEKLRPEKS